MVGQRTAAWPGNRALPSHRSCPTGLWYDNNHYNNHYAGAVTIWSKRTCRVNQHQYSRINANQLIFHQPPHYSTFTQSVSLVVYNLIHKVLSHFILSLNLINDKSRIVVMLVTFHFQSHPYNNFPLGGLQECCVGQNQSSVACR